ncbi:MAG: glycosyltransferase [Prevotellaceae bacterium]|jgi:hypothetical protein|nr:glycosyltransferase [Prevotellaceae bacterium]
MKNILILCDDFPPVSNPRMGYLCKYLPELGWNTIVVTEFLPYKNLYRGLAEGQNVTYINYYFSKNKFWQFLKHTFVLFADLFFNYKDLVINRKAKKIIKEKNISLIISSSFRVYPALAAHKLACRYNIPFVMDLRDIFEQNVNNELVVRKIFKMQWINNLAAKIIKKKLTRQRNEILKKADAVTTVSEWHVETLSKYSSNAKLIYNGYNSEIFFFERIDNEQFIVVFTGRMYSQELRDPSMLFEAVACLSKAGKIVPKNFRLHFYLTDQFSENLIKSLAETYEILDFVECFDAVSNLEIPKILNRSSILLLLANKSTGENTPKGIMGTKTFEYLAVEKPILCVRSDEDCLEKTIFSANAGLAAKNVEEVETFILEKYAEWQQNGYTHQPVNQEYIQQFSRKRQAGQFAELFNALSLKLDVTRFQKRVTSNPNDAKPKSSTSLRGISEAIQKKTILSPISL